MLRHKTFCSAPDCADSTKSPHVGHRIAELIRALAENLDDFESIAQADEYYISLSFKDIKDPAYFIETLVRMPNHRLSRTDRYKYVRDAGYSEDLVKQFDKDKAEEISCLNGYINKQDLTSFSSISSAINGMAQENIQKVLDNLDNPQKKKRDLSYQQICVLTCVDSAQKHYLNRNNSGETFRYVPPLLSHSCLSAVRFDGYERSPKRTLLS